MKKARLIIGIISILLFGVIIFQSCVAGVGNAIEDNGESSGSAGLFLAFCMMIAGVVGVVTRKGSTGAFVTAGFYLAGGLIGVANYGSFKDLLIWSIVSFAFAVVFVCGGIVTKRQK